MSDLAYNLNGERFAVPHDASGWRVRRLKPGGRGQPEVVFSDDGAPLVLPIECGLDEFRRCVRNEPGRYRLDPVNEAAQSVDDPSPAYLQLADDIAGIGAAPSNTNDAVIRELLRANAQMIKNNTEMVNNLTDRFAGVMEAAAHLLRAADGAGLPAREPPAPEPRNAAPAPVEEPTTEAESSPMAQVLSTAVEHAMPVVNHAINTKVLGLTQEQSIALLGGTPPATAAEPAEPTEQESPDDHAPSADAGADGRDATEDATAPVDDTEPVVATDFGAHFKAIQAELSHQEFALASQAVTQMAPEVLADWKQRLLRLSPGAAAALIRAEIRRGAK